MIVWISPAILAPMAAGASRFRKLPPPRAEPRPRPDEVEVPVRAEAGTGDLFEHYGIDTGRGEGVLGPIVAATACAGCGWLRRDEELARACPLCAGPGPSISTPRR